MGATPTAHEQKLPAQPDEEAREWLKKQGYTDDFKLVKAFIGSESFMDKAFAITIIEKWNAAYPDKEQFKLSDFGLTPADKSKEEEEDKTQETNKKPQRNPPGTQATLQIGGQDYVCKLLTNEGGYHDIYSIEDSKPVRKGVNNSELLVRVPVGKDSPSTSKGMLMYRNLSSKIRVPKIYNNPQADNFYVVEKIAKECNPVLWSGHQPYKDLLDPLKRQIQQIKTELTKIANEGWSNKGGKESVPDFRPANIRFTVNDELVLIDFSEEGEDQDLEYFVAMLKEHVEQFAGKIFEKGSACNPDVYRELIENFPEELKAMMKESNSMMLF
jgi:hypothetical protein